MLEVVESHDELVITIETTARLVWLRGVRRARRGAGSDAGRDPRSGVLRAAGTAGVAQAAVALPRGPSCDAKTWTEHSEHVDAQAVITRRAGMEACRQVGENARPVSQVADEFGVCWWTVMNAVIEHGTPLVDDPDRVGPVRQLGVDETSFLRRQPVRMRRSTRPAWSISRHGS